MLTCKEKYYSPSHKPINHGRYAALASILLLLAHHLPPLEIGGGYKLRQVDVPASIVSLVCQAKSSNIQPFIYFLF